MPSHRAQLPNDPLELLTARAMGDALGGISADEVSNKRARGELFAVVFPQESVEPKYPAFQAWDGAAGGPLRDVLTTLRDAGDDAAAFIFFAGRTADIGDLTPAEVLIGHTVLPADQVTRAAREILGMPFERRLAGILACARAFVAEATS